MEIKQVKLIYFSPTGTGQRVLEGIAKGMSVKNVTRIDMTLPEESRQEISLSSDELAIIGAPVYGGRVPAEAVKRFRQLKADKTPAVIVVVYGNREFEDALLELKNVSMELGFNPVAGGAFIGEHSFATKDIPIASGRPDDLDIQKAMEFGAKIMSKILAMEPSASPGGLEIPGRFPYESAVRAMTVAPVTIEDKCTLCGMCAAVCPTAAISVNEKVETKAELCIRCSACIKKCPEDARFWEDEMMKTITNWLYENCSARKEPRIFGVDNK